MSGFRRIKWKRFRGKKTSKVKQTSAKKRLSEHAPFFQLLLDADPHRWNYILDHLTDSQIEALRDLVRNFLATRVPVSSGELRELKAKRKLLHQFSKAGSRLRRRVLVKQVGKGVFSILIPALASLVGALISR
jgi:hypothetical protein